MGRTERELKKIVTRAAALLLIVSAALCFCACGKDPTKSDAEKFVKKNVPEPSHFIEETGDGTFVFESDLRDLKFEVETREMGTASEENSSSSATSLTG